MRRYSFRGGFWLVGLAILTGAALAACGGSSSPGSSTATQPSGGSTATASSGTAPTAASTAAQSSSRTLPGDACTLLTNDEASQIAGGPVTGNTGPAVPGLFPGGTTAPCHYYGDNGTGDHPVTIWVTSFTDAGAAQTFMQGQQTLYQAAAQGFQSVANMGDEAFEYTAASAAVIQVRLGSLVLLLQAGNSDFAAPSMSALEAAARTAIGRL
jgi:hypothetical protein